MTQHTITCSECGNNDNSKMFITEDGRYSVCSICGARTTLYSDYVIQEHTGHVEVEGIAGKQARIDSANHLIKLGEYGRAQKLFERLTDDYADSSASWYGLARAVTHDFSVTNNNDVALPALDHAIYNAKSDLAMDRAANSAKDFLVIKLEKGKQIVALTAEIEKLNLEITTVTTEERNLQSTHTRELEYTREEISRKQREVREHSDIHAESSRKDCFNILGFCIAGLIGYRIFLLIGSIDNGIVRVFFTVCLALSLIGLGSLWFSKIRENRAGTRALQEGLRETRHNIEKLKAFLQSDQTRLTQKKQVVTEKLRNATARKADYIHQLDQAQAEYAGMAQYKPSTSFSGDVNDAGMAQYKPSTRFSGDVNDAGIAQFKPNTSFSGDVNDAGIADIEIDWRY